jgi:hypothetical protein
MRGTVQGIHRVSKQPRNRTGGRMFLPGLPFTPFFIRYSDLDQYVEEIIAGLPLKFWVPILLHYFYGMNHAEIAEIMQMSRSRIIRWMARAHGLLRRMIRRAGLGTSLSVLSVAGCNSTPVEPPCLPSSEIYVRSRLAQAFDAVTKASMFELITSYGIMMTGSRMKIVSLILIIAILAAGLVTAFHHDNFSETSGENSVKNELTHQELVSSVEDYRIETIRMAGLVLLD